MIARYPAFFACWWYLEPRTRQRTEIRKVSRHDATARLEFGGMWSKNPRPDLQSMRELMRHERYVTSLPTLRALNGAWFAPDEEKRDGSRERTRSDRQPARNAKDWQHWHSRVHVRDLHSRCTYEKRFAGRFSIRRLIKSSATRGEQRMSQFNKRLVIWMKEFLIRCRVVRETLALDCLWYPKSRRSSNRCALARKSSVIEPSTESKMLRALARIRYRSSVMMWSRRDDWFARSVANPRHTEHLYTLTRHNNCISYIFVNI